MFIPLQSQSPNAAPAAKKLSEIRIWVLTLCHPLCYNIIC